MKRHLWVLAIVGLASCTPYAVNVDYDTEADFSKLRTYAWHTASGDVPAVDSLTQKRIIRAVDDALAARGYKQADEKPDFKVFTLASINQRISSQPITTAYTAMRCQLATSDSPMPARLMGKTPACRSRSCASAGGTSHDCAARGQIPCRLPADSPCRDRVRPASADSP